MQSERLNALLNWIRPPVEHPQLGLLISLQDLAHGFGEHTSSVLHIPGFRTVRVLRHTYVPVIDVVDVVVSGCYLGGGFSPIREFRAFVRALRSQPPPSAWQLHSDTGEWLIRGAECDITLTPLESDNAGGDYEAKMHVDGDADWFVDFYRYDCNNWPRYYFELEVAKAEAVAWLKRNNQYVNGTSKG